MLGSIPNRIKPIVYQHSTYRISGKHSMPEVEGETRGPSSIQHFIRNNFFGYPCGRGFSCSLALFWLRGGGRLNPKPSLLSGYVLFKFFRYPFKIFFEFEIMQYWMEATNLHIKRRNFRVAEFPIDFLGDSAPSSPLPRSAPTSQSKSFVQYF